MGRDIKRLIERLEEATKGIKAGDKVRFQFDLNVTGRTSEDPPDGTIGIVMKVRPCGFSGLCAQVRITSGPKKGSKWWGSLGSIVRVS